MVACKKEGFTLIELIVVIIIIGILASIAVSTMMDLRAKAIVSEAILGIGTIRISISQYLVEKDFTTAPGSGGGWGKTVTPENAAYFPGLSLRNAQSQYLSPATDGAPPSLDGTYFSQDCYLLKYQLTANVGIVIYVKAEDGNQATKSADTISTTDGPWAYICYYVSTAKFKQFNWSKTGFPEDDGYKE